VRSPLNHTVTQKLCGYGSLGLGWAVAFFFSGRGVERNTDALFPPWGVGVWGSGEVTSEAHLSWGLGGLLELLGVSEVMGVG
jgi:hypothetical protein